MRQVQFIPFINGKPAKRTVFSAYFLTDDALYRMVSDILDRANFRGEKGAHELRITDRKGGQISYYTQKCSWSILKVLAAYCKRRKEAQAACKKRWPVFWRIAGEKWRMTVVLREMERRHSAIPAGPVL